MGSTESAATASVIKRLHHVGSIRHPPSFEYEHQAPSTSTKHQHQAPAPSTKNQAPSTKHQAPSTKHQAPSTKHQAPSTKHQAPAPSTSTKHQHQAPSTSTKLPPTTYHLPPTTYRLPPTAYRLPPTAYHLPPTTYHLPPTTYRLPPTAYRLFSPIPECDAGTLPVLVRRKGKGKTARVGRGWPDGPRDARGVFTAAGRFDEDRLAHDKTPCRWLDTASRRLPQPIRLSRWPTCRSPDRPPCGNGCCRCRSLPSHLRSAWCTAPASRRGSPR